MTGGGRDRLAGVLLLIEDGLEVGNDDELAAALVNVGQVDLLNACLADDRR